MTVDDRVVEDLKAKIHTQEVVINTLRGMLFTAWTLTNSYEYDTDDD
jgi:hypothetical protein